MKRYLGLAAAAALLIAASLIAGASRASELVSVTDGEAEAARGGACYMVTATPSCSASVGQKLWYTEYCSSANLWDFYYQPGDTSCLNNGGCFSPCGRYCSSSRTTSFYDCAGSYHSL